MSRMKEDGHVDLVVQNPRNQQSYHECPCPLAYKTQITMY